MNKNEFIACLKDKLSTLPPKELDEHINFYSEMIDDRVEEGISEEEAVLQIGSADKIASQILAESSSTPQTHKMPSKTHRLKTWEIVVLALGSPLWVSLLIVVFATIFTIFASLFSAIISLWAVFGSLVACAAASLPLCILYLFTSKATSGLVILALGIVCAGLSIFTFYACKLITKGLVFATQKFALIIKKSFVKKESANE